MNIVYQGIPGSYSDQAVNILYPDETHIPCSSFESVFQSLVTKQGTIAVVPIENSIIGSLYEIIDALSANHAYILNELHLPVQHALLGKEGASMDNIRIVFSHPKALEQCSNFFSNHPHIIAVQFEDTAAAAKHVRQIHNTSVAAIASEYAAKLYGLSILKQSIQNHPLNVTRFISITRNMPSTQNGDKTSLIFSTKNIPGALMRALAPFSQRNINLTKIESRPTRNAPMRYMFYVEFEHSNTKQTIHDIIEELKKHTLMIQYLGTYKKHDYKNYI